MERAALVNPPSSQGSEHAKPAAPGAQFAKPFANESERVETAFAPPGGAAAQWTFGDIPLLQRKLSVGSVDDPLEHEADTVAERVMRMAAPPIEGRSAADVAMRKCAECKDEEDEHEIARKAFSADRSTPAEVPPSVQMTLNRPGEALHPATRNFFESRFGRDFSGVSVHAGPLAAESAQSIGARAYTSGNSVVFANGEYAPATNAGRQLIAHELTHVVQQGAAPALPLQRKPASPARQWAEQDPSAVVRSLGPGRPLSQPQRARFEPAFGVDLSAVQIHDDAASAGLTESLNTRAFTVGYHIAFSGEAAQSRSVMAHELAHVVQQSRDSGPSQSYERYEHEARMAAVAVETGEPVGTLSSVRGFAFQADDPPDALGGSGAAISMTASFRGLQFHQPGGMFRPGVSRIHQALELMLRRLLRQQAFSADLPARAYADLRGTAGGDGWSEPFVDGAPTEAEAVRPNPFSLTAVTSVQLIGWLRDGHFGPHFQVDITPAQEELLALGLTAHDLWLEVESIQVGASILPRWYTEDIFTAEMANFGTVLRQARTAFQMAPSDDRFEAIGSAVDTAIEAVRPAADALEAIRADRALVDDPWYTLLWRPGEVPAAAVHGRRPAAHVADPQGPLNFAAAITFLSFARTQPAFITTAAGGPSGASARRELLTRFGHYFARSIAVSEGDQLLLANPGLANAPPFDAQLITQPPVGPPSFTHPLQAELAAIMRLQFNDIFDAFTRYSYEFELMRVPDDQWVGSPSTAAPAAPGTAPPAEAQVVPMPSRGDMLDQRLARNERYRKADLQTYVGHLQLVFGPPGVTVADFVGVMRNLGTRISWFFETLSDPQNLRRFTFPGEGLYVVRCRAIPVLSEPETAEVRRPPSIAYVPVFARAPELVAVTGVQHQFDTRLRNDARIAEIDRLLGEMPRPTNFRELTEERQQLARQRSVGGSLESLRDTINSRLAKPDVTESERTTLREQLSRIDRILEVRRGRGIGPGAERVYAEFVGDDGQTRQLLLDAVDISPDDFPQWRRRFRVYDSTAPSSGVDNGEAQISLAEYAAGQSARAPAIRRAVRSVLQGTMGYGRGYVSILVDGATYTERIEADNASLMMEAISSAATVFSIAAIVAAPFTGGASLYLLIPIGVVGAIPSAYRIATRVEAGNFAWDLATAMDIVNIVGAFIGVGAEAAVAGQAVRVGRALMVAGFGVDALNVVLMGAEIADQLESLRGLPPEMRAARMMDIVGGAMLNAGIMVGGALAARSRLHDTEPGRTRETFEEWRHGLDEETRRLLTEHEDLRDLFGGMTERVRDILTMCGSYCVPPEVTRPQAARIEALLERIHATPDQERALKVYFHDGRANLDAAIRRLEGYTRPQDVRAFLTRTVPAADSALLSWVRLREDPVMRQRAEDIVGSGVISARDLGDIMDVVKTRGGVGSRMLEVLVGLVTRAPGARNLSHVISELKSPYEFHEGARWVLEYIHENNLWGRVTEFEARSSSGERRWDALIGGARYEFKSWSAFYDEPFVRQILQDYNLSSGFQTNPTRWVFEPRIGDAALLRQEMAAALNRAVGREGLGLTQPIADAIIRRLPQIVIVP